jgi:hypothetical protein
MEKKNYCIISGSEDSDIGICTAPDDSECKFYEECSCADDSCDICLFSGAYLNPGKCLCQNAIDESRGSK